MRLFLTLFEILIEDHVFGVYLYSVLILLFKPCWLNFQKFNLFDTGEPKVLNLAEKVR